MARLFQISRPLPRRPLRLLLPLLAVALLVAAAPRPAEAASSTPQAGGTGGTAFTLTCPDGKALIGIKGKAASYVDSIRAVCARFDAIGQASGVVSTGVKGGSGGQAYELRCPSGQVVTGLRGRAAGWVDQIGIVCAEISRTGEALATTAASVPFRAGGAGGSSFSLDCPANEPGRGLKGRSGWYIDRIGLFCQRSTIGAVQTSQTRRDLRVVVKGLPFKAREHDQVAYRVELWNVGGAGAPEGAELDLTTTYPIGFPLIEVPFLGNGGCDVHTSYGTGIITRCETGGITAPGTARMGVTVTFDAYIAGSYSFGGKADPRAVLTEASETNNSASATMTVVH